MDLKIIQNRNKFFILSGILILASILSLIFWGLNLGIDFTGGSLLEINIQGENNFSSQDVSNIIKKNMPEIGEVRVHPTDEGFLIRMRNLNEEEHQEIIKTLKTLEHENTEIQLNQQELFSLEEKRFESIGPITGQELKTKTFWAIGITLLMIILYIAWAFRKISKPVASWKYGLGAILALIHDILIVIGTFSILGHFLNYEIDILFVTALLTILGYSVHDTVVVYDRTRENLVYNPQTTFEKTVNISVNQTMGRSINTSLTTLFILLALYFFGGDTVKNFVLALIIGILIGTYSSIFIASTLLIVWQKIKQSR